MTDRQIATARPRLLYLSPVVPATSGNGLAMRAGMVLRLLSRHYDVSLLVVRLYAPYDTDVPDEIVRLCSHTAIVPVQRTAPEPSPSRLRRLLRPLRRTRRGRSSHGSRDRLIAEASRAFGDATFDVLHVFRLSMLPFARPYLDAPERHLDLDDIESTTRRRLAALYRQNGKDARAIFEELGAERAEADETEVLRSFDRIYVCSEDDKAELESRARARVCVLPNALPLPDSPSSERGERPFTFLFVGTLGYYPNEDAVVFFCTDVLPLIRRVAQQPFRVTIVGAGAPPSIRRLADVPEVRLVGAVPDLAPWYGEADAAIVPIRAGGGTRIKVLEAFRYECPVVGTTVGMEGIAARTGEHVLVGDTPSALAEHCLRLMSDPVLVERLASNAGALFRQAYTYEAVARRLDACS